MHAPRAALFAAVGACVLAAGIGVVLVRHLTPRATVVSMHGSLVAWASTFASSQPGPGSGGYDVPTAGEQDDYVNALLRAQAGHYAAAEQILTSLGYRLDRYLDTDTGRPLALIHPTASAVARGWGWAAVPQSRRVSSCVVEVAHPVADRHTEIVGVQIFQQMDAEALVVAGANRNALGRGGAADVAHDDRSMMAAVTSALARPGTVVVQPHGFAHAHWPSYGDAVISSGSSSPDAVARGVAATLNRGGWATCLADGGECAGLEAWTNVEGQRARAAGAAFLHVEMSDRVREAEPLRDRFVRELCDGLRSSLPDLTRPGVAGG